MMRKTLVTLVPIAAALLLTGCGWAAAHVGNHHGGGHHGGGHHAHHAIAELIDDLELSQDQKARVETLHESFAGLHGGDRHAAHAAHLDALIEHLETGSLDAADVRAAVDGHIEEMRALAYAAGDQLVALLDSLDEDQRATLLEHLRQAAAHADEHGHD